MNTKLASLFHRTWVFMLPLLMAGALAACHKHPAATYPTAFGPMDQQALEQMAQASAPGTDWKMRILCILGGALFGALIGAFFSDRAKAFRKWLLLAMVGIAFIFGVFLSNTSAFLSAALAAGAATYIALRIHEAKDAGDGFEPIFGNARPATHEEIAAAGHAAVRDPATNTVIRNKPGIPLGTLT